MNDRQQKREHLLTYRGQALAGFTLLLKELGQFKKKGPTMRDFGKQDAVALAAVYMTVMEALHLSDDEQKQVLDNARNLVPKLTGGLEVDVELLE